MIRRPPRSTLDRSSAASDVYKRQDAQIGGVAGGDEGAEAELAAEAVQPVGMPVQCGLCLLYTSPSPRDRTRDRMPSSA